MQPFPLYRLRLLALAATSAFMGNAAWAQYSSQAQAAPRPVAPATAAPMGTPSASGLTSPSPFPQGLPSPLPYPAGIPSPVTAAPGTVPAMPGDATPAAPLPSSGVAPAVGGPAAPAAAMGAGPGPYSAVQIAQSFLVADSNRDGQLSRAEAQRLAIVPMAFEEMDRNKDGVLSRSEYDDAVR